MSRTYRLSEAIQSAHDADFPYVMVSWTAGEDVPFVGVDLAEAGRLAAEHLIATGRRKFGYIIDRIGSLNGELRVSQFRRTVEDALLTIDPAHVFEYPFEGEWNDYNSGYAVGERIANLESRPDAVFAFNDLGALGLMDSLLDAGIRVPEDVAIVGLDDIELASRARVPLTTVRQPVDEIGARALDTVLARLRGEKPALRQLLAPELVVRGSTPAVMAVTSA